MLHSVGVSWDRPQGCGSAGHPSLKNEGNFKLGIHTINNSTQLSTVDY